MRHTSTYLHIHTHFLPPDLRNKKDTPELGMEAQISNPSTPELGMEATSPTQHSFEKLKQEVYKLVPKQTRLASKRHYLKISQFFSPDLKRTGCALSRTLCV